MKARGLPASSGARPLTARAGGSGACSARSRAPKSTRVRGHSVPRLRRLVAAGAAVAVLLALLTSMTGTAAAAAGSEAPGAPGASANWTTGSKQGLGTATSRHSKVWHTLSNGALSEVYFPSGDTANVRSLEFAVTDGATFTDRESEDTTHAIRLADERSLTYTQVNTARSGRYRLTKTYVTDPVRATVLLRVTFEALTPGDYRLFALFDPALGNSSRHDTALRRGSGDDVALLARDGDVASALVGSGGFARTSSGFVGTSDGWTDLGGDHALDFDYDRAPDGNVLQTAEIPLAGRRDDEVHARARLRRLDRGGRADRPRRPARILRPHRRRLSARLARLPALAQARPGRAPRAQRTQYDVAAMTVKAHDDKTYHGAFIASLTLPWGFAVNADEGGAGYHFVWARDLYQQAPRCSPRATAPPPTPRSRGCSRASSSPTGPSRRPRRSTARRSRAPSSSTRRPSR